MINRPSTPIELLPKMIDSITHVSELITMYSAVEYAQLVERIIELISSVNDNKTIEVELTGDFTLYCRNQGGRKEIWLYSEGLEVSLEKLIAMIQESKLVSNTLYKYYFNDDSDLAKMKPMVLTSKETKYLQDLVVTNITDDSNLRTIPIVDDLSFGEFLKFALFDETYIITYEIIMDFSRGLDHLRLYRSVGNMLAFFNQYYFSIVDRLDSYTKALQLYLSKDLTPIVLAYIL